MLKQKRTRSKLSPDQLPKITAYITADLSSFQLADKSAKNNWQVWTEKHDAAWRSLDKGILFTLLAAFVMC